MDAAAERAEPTVSGDDPEPPPEEGKRDTSSPSILAIPEQEFTPRVRAAIAELMQETERLRREVEQTRARLEEMARAADQDTLLPVLNRRAFVRELSRSIGIAKRYGTPSSLLYFDLDDFKLVNDRYGHAAGDAVLRHFSDFLTSQIRDSDVLARIGGDEFAVILAHVTPDQAAKKGAALAGLFCEKPPILNGEAVLLSFSYGAHELQADSNADFALSEADKAMYAQKKLAVKGFRP